jgi:hypothetical protein
MKVSASQPFQIIYSLYLHEYLGFIFESYIVHLDEKGKLTYQHQNISSKNAREFSKGLDDRDFELIDIMDSMHQDAIVKPERTTRRRAMSLCRSKLKITWRSVGQKFWRS